MPRVIRETLVSFRELAITWGPFVLIALVLLGVAYYLLDPAPPKKVVLATGPERSAYHQFGKRYAEELKRYGIQVQLLTTNGARENLRMLRDPKQHVDIGFVQGGASERIRRDDEKKKDEEEPLELESLGSLFFEPVWIFYREDSAKKLNKKGVLESVTGLRGWRVNTGGRGSGTPGLMNRLLDANQMSREDLKRSSLGETESVMGMLEGSLDAIVLVSAPESPMVQMLLQTPGVRLLDFTQAEAYARRYGYISPVILPRGVAHLANNVPAEDVHLIAPTTSLVAREDTHPALVQLFVQAAARIHSGPGWIARAGQFPTGAKTEFPLADEAERFYRNGPPLLQRYLPFWLANLIERMWVALFSIVAVLIPLSRLLPPLYQFRVRSRVFRWYRNLRGIENRLENRQASRAELLGELEKLDAKAARIHVPLSYADELYRLRAHINLVRSRLQQTA